MTPELLALACAGLLQVVQFLLMSVTANLDLGPQKTLGPRDPDDLGGPLHELVSRRTGRLIRALDNHFEGLIIFTLAVVVVVLSDQSTGFTSACAWIYLIARILYVPAYYFGWTPWRSVIWSVGFGATTLMLISALI